MQSQYRALQYSVSRGKKNVRNEIHDETNSATAPYVGSSSGAQAYYKISLMKFNA